MVTLAQAKANPREFLGRDCRLNEVDDVQISSQDDFARIIYEDNLKQAIKSRLKTEQGELTLNPLYGSRLHILLGQSGLPQKLILAKMYCKEALLQEPRIKEITKIKPTFRTGSLNQIIDIQIEVIPINTNQPLNLVFSVFLEEVT